MKDLMGKLVEQVSKAESTDYQKEAALEAIGYICSDIVSFENVYTLSSYLYLYVSFICFEIYSQFVFIKYKIKLFLILPDF